MIVLTTLQKMASAYPEGSDDKVRPVTYASYHLSVIMHSSHVLMKVTLQKAASFLKETSSNMQCGLMDANSTAAILNVRRNLVGT